MAERIESSPQIGRRVATVDVGTNSIRLLVAEARPDGRYRLLDDEKVVTRLGRGMARTGALDPAVMDESARAIARMKAIAEGYHVEMLRAVATCAVREATNGPAFVDLVRREAGLELDVISGEEEARLAYLSVKGAFDLRNRDVAVVDIGGGSTEIVLSTAGVIERIDSLPLGAVRLTEALEGDRLAPDLRLRRLRKLIKQELRRVRKPVAPPALVIGTGGTFTTLAVMDALARDRPRADRTPPPSVRGYEIKLAGVRRWLDHLSTLAPRRRLEVAGLSPDRAEIIVAGLAIASSVMKRLGVNVLQVHDRGIRDGLLLSMTHELFPASAWEAATAPADRLRGVRQFAARCHYERDHSEHVTDLALQIYDQMVATVPSLPAAVTAPAARDVLHAAGVLHDIGYLINYARHHKHSYHLIMHGDLPGFDHRELELVANVARYHRRAHPKRGHPNFKRLAPDDQPLVRYLAAVLRIADGLDRGHAGHVRRVRVEVDRRTVWFVAEAAHEPEVDLWGAARKSQLFSRVLSMEPRFTWRQATAAPDAAPATTPPLVPTAAPDGPAGSQGRR